jgi:Uma2 family endonuclease
MIKMRIQNRPSHSFTEEEYFALERVGQRCFEYWNGNIFCMQCLRPEHDVIRSNVAAAFTQQMERPTYRVHTGRTPVSTPSLPPYRYPDVIVASSDQQFEPIQNKDILLNPVLIVEVLEPESSLMERQEKRLAYQALPSVRELLLISDDIPHVTRYTRQSEGWRRKDYGQLRSLIDVPSFNCQLELVDIYRGITFE